MKRFERRDNGLQRILQLSPISHPVRKEPLTHLKKVAIRIMV